MLLLLLSIITDRHHFSKNEHFVVFAPVAFRFGRHRGTALMAVPELYDVETAAVQTAAYSDSSTEKTLPQWGHLISFIQVMCFGLIA